MLDAADTAQPCPNWKVILAYDGTDFSGWQVQPGERTIQGELQAALGRVTGERPLPQGSGRTDAGVHALAQVASFGLAARIPADNLLRALNRTLPQAIRIVDAKIVPSSFHARHSTVAKTYEYRVFQGQLCPPFLARYVHACPWTIDLEQLRDAARRLQGEHDFTSFAATDPDLKERGSVGEKLGSVGEKQGPVGVGHSERPVESEALHGKQGAVRTIFSSNWERQESTDGPILIYQVRGNGFLHHMVRNVVGTMLDVGRGYTQADGIGEILAARSRAAAGPTAPAQGLFLKSVDYDGSV